MFLSFPLPPSPFRLCFALVAILANGAVAQDTIVLSPRPDDPGRIVLSGTVVEYNGGLLTYQDAAGASRSVPGKQVVEVRSKWHADHAAGDEAWRRRDFATAATKFQSALAAEPRRWARRLIQSRLIATLRELDRWEAAAEQFLLLTKEDPATPYFAVIPLPWTTTAPPPSLEAKAKLWAADRSAHLAALLGSSFLLATPERSEALRRLRELAQNADSRIAQLAEAQLWRAAAVTAEADTVNGWQRALEKIPEPLRPGPYLVVGRAWSQRNQPERAALTLLRVPILYGDEQPRLAAEALWSAGQALEQLAQPQQAASLYRELVRDFRQAIAAAGAKDRLTELQPTTK